MVRYYKLFDLLNRKDMKISDLRKILSSATVAKLRKGEHITTKAIEKICLLLGCQPGDIMEVIAETEQIDENSAFITKNKILDEEIPYNEGPIEYQEIYYEQKPKNFTLAESDEEGETYRQIMESTNPLEPYNV